MNAPPSLPNAPALETGQRVRRAVGGALVLAILVYLVWATIQFCVAASATSKAKGELLGYSAILTSPLASALALLVGAVLGAMAPKGLLRWRILWTTLIFAVLAAGWAAYLYLSAK